MSRNARLFRLIRPIFLLLLAVVLHGSRNVASAQKVASEIFVGSIPGLGHVWIDIPSSLKNSDRHDSTDMISDSADISFGIRSDHDDLILTAKPFGTMRCRLSNDNLSGFWEPRGRAAMPFMLHGIGSYREIRRPIPVPVRYEAAVKGVGQFWIYTDSNRALGGFLEGGRGTRPEILDCHGSVNPGGHVVLGDTSLSFEFAFTGTMQDFGKRIDGVAYMSDQRKLSLQFHKIRSKYRRPPFEIKPFKANYPLFFRGKSEMLDTVGTLFDRTVEEWYCQNLEWAWSPSGLVGSEISVDVGISVAYYSDSLISASLFTGGNTDWGWEMGYDSLVSIGIIGGHPRVLTLSDLFKPKSLYNKRLEALIRAHITRDSVMGFGETEDPFLDYSSWYIIKDGLSFDLRLRPHTLKVEPWASVVIPFSELRDLIDPNGPLGRFVRRDR